MNPYKHRKIAGDSSDSDSEKQTTDNDIITTEMNSPSFASSPFTEPEYDVIEKNSTRITRLQRIVDHQFDLEILLKHRELRIIEDRIAQVHTKMVQLRKLHSNPIQHCELDPEDFVSRYAKYLQTPITKSPNLSDSGEIIPNVLPPQDYQGMNLRRYRQPTAKFISNGGYLYKSSLQCVYRRPDGVLVRLVCADCSRSDFGSPQGFINHCRISHSRDYSSHDSAASACGVEVEEQDNIGREVLRQRNVAYSRSHINTKTPPPETPCYPEHISTHIETKKQSCKNLKALVKAKNLDVDLPSLIESSLNQIPKSHLFEDEDDSDDDTNMLGEEASPFQRVIAEARKLKLNVDEILSSTRNANSKYHSKKKKENKKVKESNFNNTDDNQTNVDVDGRRKLNNEETKSEEFEKENLDQITKTSDTSNSQSSLEICSNMSDSPTNQSVDDSQIKSFDKFPESRSSYVISTKPRSRRSLNSIPHRMISLPRCMGTRSKTRNEKSFRTKCSASNVKDGNVISQMSKFLSLDRFF